MVTHIKIHGQSYINAFETPPRLNIDEQKQHFYLPRWVEKKLKNFYSPTNKVGFVLQLGYFRITNKFFVARKYHKADIAFVCRDLSISVEEVDLKKYVGTTYERHQDDILENIGYQKFDSVSKSILMEEAHILSSKQVRPQLIFMSLIDFLGKKKMEVPSYHALKEVITLAMKNYEKRLLDEIDKCMTEQQKSLLQELLDIDEKYSEKKKNFKIHRYKLTLLKKSKQSIKPSRIKENIKDLVSLKSIFFELEPIIHHLGIAPELIDYYANLVIKSQIFQIPKP